MENCVFCKIIKGDIPAYKVYEDEKVLAFLEIEPVEVGHVLVIPKVHEPDIYKLDDQNYAHFMKVVKQLSGVVAATYKPKKVGLLAMGFDVAHAHMHIVPLHHFDDMRLKAERVKLSEEEFEKNAEVLRKVRS